MSVRLILQRFEKEGKYAEGRNRTDMGLLPPDFESGALLKHFNSIESTTYKISV